MKTKAVISFKVTTKLICVFVFAYAKRWFSHDMAQFNLNSVNLGSSRDIVWGPVQEDCLSIMTFNEWHRHRFVVFIFCICIFNGVTKDQYWYLNLGREGANLDLDCLYIHNPVWHVVPLDYMIDKARVVLFLVLPTLLTKFF